MKYLKVVVASLLAGLVWAALAFYGGLNGWWLDAVAERGDTKAFMDAATTMIDSSSPGSVALVLIRNGEIHVERYRGSDRSIDGDTLFATASFSKWPAAYGVMLLAQSGKIDLEAPVSRYLSRWQLPEGRFDNNKVTVGRLLSHTAGLTDGLGFGDYDADEALPGLEESLANPRDSDDADVQIAVGNEPGEGWDYSGGGYLVLELMVEEVSGQGFAEYMAQSVFEPLGMTRSNYGFLGAQDDSAGSYDRTGNAAPLFQYAAKSATGLNANAMDLVRFVQAQLDDSGPLRKGAVQAMRQPRGYELGAAIWGRGVMLHSPNGEGDYIFGHDGANEPSINASVRINPANDDAIIALSTGPAYLASRIAYEWGLWQSGYPDFIQSGLAIESAMRPMLTGVLLIAALAIVLLIRLSRATA